MMSTVLFSKPCTYAIRALTYLATQAPGKLSGTREISEREGIPSSFLGKVLLQLRRVRLLRSYRGTRGGYELALPPDQINLLKIVLSVDGDVAFKRCILEDQECMGNSECPLHESWAALREQLIRFLQDKTLADLARMRQIKSSETPRKSQVSSGSRLSGQEKLPSKNGPIASIGGKPDKWQS